MNRRAFLEIEDLRLAAGRALPTTIFQSLQAGSWSEETLRRNIRDFAAIKLKQRVLVDVSTPQLETNVLGQTFSLPFGLGPTGMHGLFHRSAECAPALAAKEAGIPFCMSTMATRSLEEVIAETGSPIWLQLFMLRDRGFVRAFIERAIDAGCGALFITVDLPARGKRIVDFRNGMTVPPRFTIRNFIEFALRPNWALGALDMRKRVLGNLQGHVSGLEDADEVLKWTDTQYDDTVTWRDIEWVRDLWPGPLLLKGILDPDDARTAVSVGAQGIVVSNHGGRQLDIAGSTISALPLIADAVGGDLELLLDGGIRSGQDVLKALALGASFCLLGRAYLYGLAAAGQNGVSAAIDIIRDELKAAMALTGVTQVGDIGPQLVDDRCRETPRRMGRRVDGPTAPVATQAFAREATMETGIIDQVRDLHARYTDAVWRKDLVAFGECFTCDAEWRIGGLELRGRDTVVSAFERIIANFRKVLITFQTPIIDVTGERPCARTYIGEQVARADGTANISIGRYYEFFAFEDGRWRFDWRLFQLHYSGPPDLSGRYFDWNDYGAPPGMPPLDAPSGAFAAEKWNM